MGFKGEVKMANYSKNDIVRLNKLIADFMGAKYDKDVSFNIGSGSLWLPIHGICSYFSIDVGYGHILKYHNSWDWLIPVIDKITSSDSYIEYVDYSSSMISSGGVEINTKYIDVTYENVCRFMEWHLAKVGR